MDPKLKIQNIEKIQAVYKGFIVRNKFEKKSFIQPDIYKLNHKNV